ncbi:MAG: acyltransferase family protein [Firmicutes bacterium]|nr:acyltransferase family protein [Bacillota bacterium]
MVCLHACSTLTDNPELFEMSDIQSWFFNAGHHIMDWAVPVFFMITGSLLLNPQKPISFKKCLSKYCFRIVLALFVFGIPFAMMRLYMETRTINLLMLVKAVGCVFTNSGLSHLWYLYSLIGIYLLLPVIEMFVDHADRNTFSYILTTMFIFVFCLPTLSDLIGAEIAFSMPLKYPVFYVMLGYYLKEYIGKWKARYCLIGIFSILAVFVVADYFNFTSGVLASYDSPFTALLAALIFMVFKNINQDGITESKAALLWKIDRLCFGVYLVHPVFIQFVYRVLKITPLSFSLYPLAILAFSLFFVICSFFASRVMSLIKPLKKYIL